MKADGADSRALARVKQKNYLICAALMVLGAACSRLPMFSFDGRLVLLMLVWAASFVAVGVGVGAGWIPVRVSGVFSGLIAVTASTWTVYISGGLDSPFYPALVTLPVVLSMFTPDDWRPTLLCGVSMMGGVVLLDLSEGMSGARMLPQLLTLGIIVGLALFGSRTYRRMWGTQQAAQQERMAALERLAESERRRVLTERERAEVDRLVLVGQLAAGVAHEVNNPLAYVKSNLSYLEREVDSPDAVLDRSELREVIAETRQGVQRIQQIVTDLRGFSRADLLAPEAGLPAEALQEAKRLASVRLHALPHVRLEADLPAGLPPVRLGHRHLVQVLLNLLINAADAAEGLGPTRPVRIGVEARRVAGGVRLVVEDDGPGFSQEVLARLFEPFFTTKPPGKGTGLGLSLCREYVARGGGTLQAENRIGGGARFILLLPLAAESSREPSGATSLPGRRIE